MISKDFPETAAIAREISTALGNPRPQLGLRKGPKLVVVVEAGVDSRNAAARIDELQNILDTSDWKDLQLEIREIVVTGSWAFSPKKIGFDIDCID